MTDNLLEAVDIDSDEQTRTDKENTSVQKPVNLPDKFWDSEKNHIRLDEMIRSYLELEKKFSQKQFDGMIRSPENDEEKIAMCKILGMPETAAEYQPDLSHGLFDPDEELNNLMHEKGFTQDQVQLVYDMAAEKLVPLIMEMSSEFQADREVERLIETFGGHEQWREVSRQLLAFGKQHLPPDVLQGLSGSYEGVMALHKMMQSESSPMNMKESDAQDSVSQDDLFDMMRDPRYWQKKDPGFISRVTKGFQQMYGQDG